MTAGRVPSPCRYCGTAYTTCVDGDPCCKACLHADGHESGRSPSRAPVEMCDSCEEVKVVTVYGEGRNRQMLCGDCVTAPARTTSPSADSGTS